MSECFGKNHYFALFDMPVAFNIDKDLLKQNLLTLQKKYHPDSQSGSTSISSELINQAYHTLANDELRAIYLLEMTNCTVNLDHSIDDVEFLSQMMDYRIGLAESQCADEIAQIHQQLDALNHQLLQAFAVSYEQKHWQDAQVIALKLKFLAKLKQDTQSNFIIRDDDELYV